MSSVKGLDKLVSQFQSMKNLDKGLALLAGAFTLQRFSMQNAPVDTGFLRNSHESRQTGDMAEMIVNAHYAFYVEFGTRFMAARAFVRKSMDENKQDIVDAVGKQVETQIKGKI